jgi:WS/DGAT/MGAT family acyltransferase
MSSWLADSGPINVHVGGTVIVQGPPPDFEEFLAHVKKRLHLVPRFRQRVTRTPLNLSNPVWGDDPLFDVGRHVRRLALPRPGGIEELKELVGQVMSEPLDKERPPWQLYLVEGLRGRRHAVISKTHHALVDGISAVDMGTAVLDLSPEGTHVKVPRKRWQPEAPSQAFLFAQSAQERIATPIKAAGRAARGAITTPAQTATRVRKTAEAFAGLAASGPGVETSVFNQRIGRDRRVAFAKTSLAKLKRARRPVEGATANDVILAVAAGGLRRFLKKRRIKLPEDLVALVPVSIRRPGEEGELGNRVASIMAPLPIAERNPAKRLARIKEETDRLKSSEAARASTLLIEAAGWAPPTINRLLSQAMSRPLVFNLVVSNVPGPQLPLYLMGGRVREIYPFVPLSPQGHAVSIGVVSYDGKVFFGLVGDRDLMPDLDQLAEAIEAALEEQLEAARPAPARTPKPKAKRRKAKRG